MIDLYHEVLTIARMIAKPLGYAIGLHGSGVRDLDLIAVPWIEEACHPEKLIYLIALDLQKFGIEAKLAPEKVPTVDAIWPNPVIKPHGRVCYTILLKGNLYVDISVIPKLEL